MKIFSGFRRKHLIITTHVEKQCTRALTSLRLESETKDRSRGKDTMTKIIRSRIVLKEV